MKKILLIACLFGGAIFTSCDTPKETTQTTTSDSSRVNTDTTVSKVDTTKHP